MNPSETNPFLSQLEYKRYVNLAVEEIINPTFAVTNQYLAVMEVEFVDGQPRLARVDKGKDTYDLYFHIKDESFYMVVRVLAGSSPGVHFVWIESGHQVYLTATSETLTFEGLSHMLPLVPLAGWSKGTLMKNGVTTYKFSRVSYNPIENEAYALEEKLSKLLQLLEPVSGEVIALSQQANVSISVCRHQYISANAGISLNSEIIRRLSEMGLTLDIDTYIVGDQIE